MQIRKLNLGCGEFQKKGYINVDSFFKADINHNLNMYPYPFKNNSFDVIEMNHCLEHLDNSFACLKELHRISSDKSLITIEVPHFSRGFTHPDHKRGFDITFPYYFDSAKKQFFQGTNLKIKKIKFIWYAQPYLKIEILHPIIHFPLYAISTVIDFFANLSPAFCSRIWCFYVGGFEAIQFTFQVTKSK
jgi:SAM-dependent methyltransferase